MLVCLCECVFVCVNPVGAGHCALIVPVCEGFSNAEPGRRSQGFPEYYIHTYILVLTVLDDFSDLCFGKSLLEYLHYFS